MSPVTTSTRSRQRVSSSQPQALNELYWASARTWAPSSTSISARCEPMNPSAPVTRTFLSIIDDAHAFDAPRKQADFGKRNGVVQATTVHWPGWPHFVELRPD